MKRIVITIHPQYTNEESLKAIVESCKIDGLEISDVFQFGVIIGSANDETIGKISNYEQVMSVADESQAHVI